MSLFLYIINSTRPLNMIFTSIFLILTLNRSKDEMMIFDDQRRLSLLTLLLAKMAWVTASSDPSAGAGEAWALLGGITLAGVWGRLMLMAADTKDEASALYPIDM